jgi:alanine dehydrogenase
VPTALAEAGDLLPLLEKGRLHARQLVEFGDIIAGMHRRADVADQITVFESQGMAIQDLAVGLRVARGGARTRAGGGIAAAVREYLTDPF